MAYKEFTCPPNQCPQETTFQEHTQYGAELFARRWWSSISLGYNCKVAISAASSLNGKLIVDLFDIRFATAVVYEIPNVLREEFGSQGLVENRTVHVARTPRVFEVPTDWTVVIHYSTGFIPGSLDIKSSVAYYEEEDIARIEDEWAQTNTYYVEEEERVEPGGTEEDQGEEEELEEQEAEEQEELQQE